MLMNNSVWIIFLIVACVVGWSEYKQYLGRNFLSHKDFRDILKSNLRKVGGELTIKFAVSTIVTIIISLISFREFWVNDCFHVVFLTNLLARPTYKRLKSLFE